MKTKIYLTMFVILMSVEIVIAQQIIYGDQNETQIANKDCDGTCDVPASVSGVFYKIDEITPNAFTTGNNTKVVCRLVPDGSDSKVVCSTSKPENGWGTMVSNLNKSGFSYEEKLHDDGANIYSIAFTDPNNGWAVGVMDTYASQSGVVFHTLDGGKTWNVQYLSGTPLLLQSVSFTDRYNGQINGVRTVGNSSFAIVLSTTDAGVTWEEQNLAHLKDPNTY